MLVCRAFPMDGRRQKRWKPESAQRRARESSFQRGLPRLKFTRLVALSGLRLNSGIRNRAGREGSAAKPSRTYLSIKVDRASSVATGRTKSQSTLVRAAILDARLDVFSARIAQAQRAHAICRRKSAPRAKRTIATLDAPEATAIMKNVVRLRKAR